jgi:hypothetical protein
MALAISCLLATTPSHAGDKGLTIAIDWNPTKPEKESVWLGTSWREPTTLLNIRMPIPSKWAR